jgi:hypothetical protein
MNRTEVLDMPVAQTVNHNYDDFSGIMSAVLKLTPSQRHLLSSFLMEPLPATKKNTVKNALKKCYGIWADRSDVSDSVKYVNDLRESWNTRLTVQDK